MSATQSDKAEAFRRLHEGDDILLLPNPRNAGSAKLLAAEGFRALATTSAGIAFSLGLPDPGPMERDVSAPAWRSGDCSGGSARREC